MVVDEHHDYEKVGKAFDRTLLRRLVPFVRPDGRSFAAGLLLLFAITGLELVQPWILRKALEGPVASADTTGVDPQIGPLLGYAGAFLGVLLLTLAARYGQFMVLMIAGQRVLHRVRQAVFRHLQRLPIAYFDRNPTGRLVSRVTTDVETLNELFTSGAVTLLGDVVKIAALVAALFVLNARLAVIALVAVPALALTSAFFRIRARRAYRATRTAIARVTAYLGETMAGAKVIQGFAREEKAAAAFAERNHAFLRANVKTVFYFALFFPCVDWIALAVQGTVFWRGGVEIAGASLTVPEFLQFWLYLGYVFEPLRELAEKYNVLQSAMASAERVFQVLDAPADADDDDDALPATSIAGAIEYRDVRFEYAAGSPVLRGVTFRAEPGETVALVGATGGGKTTITALLNRFYEPTGGTILVDGTPVDRFRRRELRARIAYVPQDVFLFTGTVLENLRSGGPGVTEAAARAAAEAIGAGPIIRRLEGGYDHVLLERGQNLSAGERQILSFARALATDPAILVLDEATASVDPETEAEIQRAIGRLLEGRTSIVVAHRLSTIRRADRIVVLHRGGVREQGTHEELLAKGDVYAKLHRLQFSGDEAPGRAVPDAPRS
ncbi:MAG: ABC transporter ATP-binding protein [Planctomycetota bacterium JB042]